MVISFLCENSLPFTLAPKLVDLAQALSLDRLALSKVQLSRCSIGYKLTDGLAEINRTRVLNMMKEYPFSLSADEAQTKTHKKVFSLLASIVNPYTNLIETHHVASEEVCRMWLFSLYIFDIYIIFGFARNCQ